MDDALFFGVLIMLFMLFISVFGNLTKNEVEDIEQNKIIYEITKHEYCYELEGKWLCYDEKK